MRGRHDGPEVDVWRRVKVENQAARLLRQERLVIPGMELDAADLGDRNERFDAIELEIWLAIAPDGDLADQG
jgi:hypothetical protein